MIRFWVKRKIFQLSSTLKSLFGIGQFCSSCNICSIFITIVRRIGVQVTSMLTLLRVASEYGTEYAVTKSERRNIVLSNYVSLIASAALFTLIVALFAFYGLGTKVVAIRLMVAGLIFLIPLFLNKIGYTITSRVLLSWLTPFSVVALSIIDLKTGEPMSSSSLVGLRLFLLAGICFPFLFFNLSEKYLLFVGLALPVLSIVFFDPIFKFFDAPYLRNAINDRYYEFSNVRAIISAIAICLSLYFLKRIVERSEQLNNSLLLQLNEKNKLIQRQAEVEVNKLNEELQTNLQLLKISENRYRSLFEQASDLIAVFELDGRFIDVNDSLCQASGYSRQELLAMRADDLVKPEDLKKKPLRYDEVLSGHHLLSHQRIVKKSGHVIDIEANIKRIQGDKIFMIARDVTQLRAAQQQILISEANFRNAFENSATGMALVSTHGQWLRVNRELCTITGYTEQELLLLRVRDIVVPEEVNLVLEAQAEMREGKRDSIRTQRRYVHKNGSIVWVNLNVSMVRNPDGTLLYLVAQIEDISYKIKAQEELTLQQANLYATINNTEVMIWSVDRNFNLLTFNYQFAEYIKKHYNIIIKLGSRIFTHTPTPDSERTVKKWRPLYEQALDGNRITLEDSRFGFDFQFSLSPIVQDGHVIGVSIFGDNITERKSRDRELAEANKKIGELRLRALSSVMSPHFIFNVLSSIQFFITKNDRLNAINYLSMFSRLVRSILKHSANNRIRLSDEIEMLHTYVDLEKMRFENKFDFTLNVSPDLETESLIIPSLLIQPYVENAILHGLYNKEGQGNLSISIYIDNQLLTFEITDDGIGREAAMKLRNENFPLHKSIGMNITKERLKLINQGQQADVEIEDLLDEHGNTGTRVRVKVVFEVG